MRVKIFSCHHEIASETLDTPLFNTIVSGLSPGCSTNGIISDTNGLNISMRQKYCEIRQQFYVWKNLLGDIDLVGFEHYRRPFFIDPLPIEHLRHDYPLLVDVRIQSLADPYRWRIEVNGWTFREYLRMRRFLDGFTERMTTDYLSAFDIITTRPRLDKLDDNWLLSHPSEIWQVFEQCVPKLEFFRKESGSIDFGIRNFPALNMYIMKADLFSEYMNICTELFFIMEGLIENPPDRIWGHLSERLFAIYLNQKRLRSPLLRVGHMAHLFCEYASIDESEP